MLEAESRDKWTRREKSPPPGLGGGAEAARTPGGLRHQRWDSRAEKAQERVAPCGLRDLT